MKKILLTMGAFALALVANAEQKVYFSEDFEWMAPWTAAAAAGDTFATNDANTSCPNLTKTATIDGASVTLYSALQERGYAFVGVHSDVDSKNAAVADRTPDKQIYMNVNYLKFGLTNYFSGMTLPKVAELGEGVEDASISFDWSTMRQGGGAFDKTELLIVVKNGETESKFAVPALNIEDNAAFAWTNTTVSLAGCKLTKDSEITIRNCDAQWPAQASAAGNQVYRWFIDNIKVFTGESSVAELDGDNAPSVYYNLQGVRVANPENGIFIRRQGGKVTKVVL